MFKRSLCAFLVLLLLLLAGTAWTAAEDLAGTPLTPEDATYDAGLFIEDAQFELAADPVEQAGMQSVYAERRLRVIEEIENPSDMEALLAGYREHERKLWRLLEGLDGANTGQGSALALMAEACEQRAQRLRAMSENSTLPEEARNGINQALENQQMAMVKLREALTNAQQAGVAVQERAGQENGKSDGNAGETPGPPAEAASGQPQGSAHGSPQGSASGRSSGEKKQ
ncbi:MAG: hypothetical protein AB1767_12590 [Bacillota bacterium]